MTNEEKKHTFAISNLGKAARKFYETHKFTDAFAEIVQVWKEEHPEVTLEDIRDQVEMGLEYLDGLGLDDEDKQAAE